MLKIKLHEFINKIDNETDPFELIKKKTPSSLPNNDVTVGVGLNTTTDDQANKGMGSDPFYSTNAYGSTIISPRISIYETDEPLEYTNEANNMGYDEFTKFLKESGKLDELDKYYESLDTAIKNKEKEIVESLLDKRSNDIDVINSSIDIDDLKKQEPLIFDKLDKCLAFFKRMNEDEIKAIRKYILQSL
jgi:translation elongation factor EF-G